MTVSTDYGPKSYKPGSAMAPEAIGFQFLDATDLTVTHVAALTGVRTPLVPGEHYVIAGDGRANTGTITAAGVWPVDDDFVIERATPALQKASLPAHQPLPSAVVEMELDRQVLVQQEQGTALALAVVALGARITAIVDLFGASLAALAAALAPYLPAALKGDKGDPGGTVLAIGAWSAFETTTIPLGTDLVQTADTLAAGSTTGTASARYKLDPEQTTYTAQMTAYINASVTAGTPLATAQAAMTALQRLWRRKSANNRWFTLAEPEPWTGQFGCPGDGGQNISGLIGATVVTMSGVDVFAPLQGFIDYCVYFARVQGRIGPGTHRVSRGLQHGYGGGYVGGVFRGSGQAYAGSSAFVGSTIVCDTDEDPVLNISGDRDVVWEGVAFVGKYEKWITVDTALAYPTAAPIAGYDSLNPQAWIADYMRRSQDGRYNPCALVTLGAYDGSTPAAGVWAQNVGYALRNVMQANGNVYQCIQAGASAATGAGPSGTGASITDNAAKWRYLGAVDMADITKFVAYRQPYRPAWLVNPLSPAYGNANYGSFCTFRDCFFQGSPTLVACKPGMNELQDDFLLFDRCNFVSFNFAISASNHQLRNFGAFNCNFGIGNCALTNNTHGVQTGSYKACHINNCGFGSGVDIFRLNASYGEPMTFTGCYTEGQMRLGQLLGGGFGNMGPLFQGCEWNLTGIHEARGYPPRQYYGYDDGSSLIDEAAAPSTLIPTTFLNCKINTDSVFGCYVPGASFINSEVYNYARGATTVARYLAAFDNATAGGLIVAGLDYVIAEQSLVFAPHNLADGTATPGQVRTERGYPAGDRARGIPAMVRSVRAAATPFLEEQTVPHTPSLILTKAGKVAFPNGADATELEFTYAGATQLAADTGHFGPGSIILDGPSGTVWAVRSFDDGTDKIVAVAQNNVKIVAGVKSFVVPVTTGGGSMAFRSGARLYTPSAVLYGTFASGSPTITAPITVGGGAVDPTTIEVAVNDYLVPRQSGVPIWAATAKVTAKTSTTITIDQNAGSNSAASRLPFFARPCPPNV